MEAARYLGESKVPYDEWLYVNEGYYCHYFYSPFWATLLIPLGNVPPFYIQCFWLVLNLFFVYRLIAQKKDNRNSVMSICLSAYPYRNLMNHLNLGLFSNEILCNLNRRINLRNPLRVLKIWFPFFQKRISTFFSFIRHVG
jgi:hypothetical protein